MSEEQYRGWIITNHGHGCISYEHEEYDVDDPRNGTAKSIDEAKRDIDEWIEAYNSHIQSMEHQTR